MLTQVLSDIELLVRCESPSTDPAANARSADLVARLGEERLGAAPERTVAGTYHHLVWRLGGAPQRVLVLGHHDTVWPLGSIDNHPFSNVDGVVRGPGCFDMKTGVAMAFSAVAALSDSSGVTVMITGDEELGSPTSRELIEAEASGCEAVFVLEASADGGAIKTQRKGVSLYHVSVRGRAAHAGLDPESGINASIELAHQVLAIAALSDEHAGTTVTPTTLTSGTTTNTVPALASVAIDARVWTTAEQERVNEALHSLRPVTPGAVIEVTGGINRRPLESSSSAALFERACALATELGLEPLSHAAVGGASDGNFTAGMGIPTLDGLGAVGGGAHADDEHVMVAEIEGRTKLLSALIADVLETSQAGQTRSESPS